MQQRLRSLYVRALPRQRGGNRQGYLGGQNQGVEVQRVRIRREFRRRLAEIDPKLMLGLRQLRSQRREARASLRDLRTLTEHVRPRHSAGIVAALGDVELLVLVSQQTLRQRDLLLQGGMAHGRRHHIADERQLRGVQLEALVVHLRRQPLQCPSIGAEQIQGIGHAHFCAVERERRDAAIADERADAECRGVDLLARCIHREIGLRPEGRSGLRRIVLLRLLEFRPRLRQRGAVVQSLLHHLIQRRRAQAMPPALRRAGCRHEPLRAAARTRSRRCALRLRFAGIGCHIDGRRRVVRRARPHNRTLSTSLPRGRRARHRTEQLHSLSFSSIQRALVEAHGDGRHHDHEQQHGPELRPAVAPSGALEHDAAHQAVEIRERQHIADHTAPSAACPRTGT